ncbi:MAG: endonuclease NucS [Acidimicrobiales bacterium]
MAKELDFEDWVAANPTMLSDGLRVVGRQLKVDGGYLDLLCLDVHDRWVVVELKRDRLYREVVAQALDYAASIRDLDGEALRELCASGAGKLAGPTDVMSAVDTQLANDEEDEREIAIIVAGAGVDPGLERVANLVAAFDLPLRVISFEVFELASGEQLLVREVIEDEEDQPTKQKTKKRSVDDIRALAASAGLQEGFDCIVDAAQQAGLFPRPYTRSIMITPASHRNRFLIVLTPEAGKGLRVNHGPEAFAEFFDGVTAESVESALGPSGNRWYSGPELMEIAALYVDFLSELPDEDAPDNGAKANFETISKIAACVEPGEWTTYGDLSRVAIGGSSAAMSIGNMAANNDDFPNPHRVLNVRGAVPPGWRSQDGGGPEECRRRLEAEGVQFLEDGSADPQQRLDVDVLASRVTHSDDS